MKEPVPAGTTITKTYYANIIINPFATGFHPHPQTLPSNIWDTHSERVNKLRPEIKKRRRTLISTDVILHHDNALSHTSYHVLSTIDNLRYELLRHPPYSPDLAPSDYYLFPLLKEYLKARRYEDRSALASSIHQCLNGLSEDDFTAAIQQLSERWRKCILVDGRNFEKEHIYI